MGRYLLEDLGISLSALDHRTFDRARKLVVSNGDAYFKRAEDAISQAILPLFDNRERTLQRLSATFRRADLVEILMQEILNGLKG
jgi:hypothetical protein